MAEVLLFLAEHADDEVALAGNVGIGVAHHVDGDLGQLGEDDLVGAEEVGVAHGPADDPAQDVATSLVGREHPVGHEHRRRAGVLGEDTDGEAVAIVVVADLVRPAGELARLVDERKHQVGLPQRVDALQHGEDTLESGPGVDRRVGQRRQRARVVAVVLHEHEVPELEEAVALGVDGGTAVGSELRPAIEVDLAAWSARPGLAGLPEVVGVAHPLDPLQRHADDVVPDLLGDVVGLVHGDPQAVTVHPPVLCHELPAGRDDELLEVVAEAEVAEHLEEHEMALGAADIVEVVVLPSGTDAFLRADGALVRRLLVAEEVGLERHHPGDVEQQRRILWHEARRRHEGVVARDEEVDERLTNFVGTARRFHHPYQCTDPPPRRPMGV